MPPIRTESGNDAVYETNRIEPKGTLLYQGAPLLIHFIDCGDKRIPRRAIRPRTTRVKLRAGSARAEGTSRRRRPGFSVTKQSHMAPLRARPRKNKALPTDQRGQSFRGSHSHRPLSGSGFGGYLQIPF